MDGDLKEQLCSADEQQSQQQDEGVAEIPSGEEQLCPAEEEHSQQQHEEEQVYVTVNSVAGLSLCTVSAPIDSTVAGIKALVRDAIGEEVNSCDYLCFGAEVLLNQQAQPLLHCGDAGGSEEIVMTLCFTNDFTVGDLVFYAGPSLYEFNVLRGDRLRVIEAADSKGKLKFSSEKTSGYIMLLVCEVCRSAPTDLALPDGYNVGDQVYYVGPQVIFNCKSSRALPMYTRMTVCQLLSQKIKLHAALATNADGAWALRPGMKGEVLEAGVIEGSLRVRFEGKAPRSIACSVTKLSREAPARSAGGFWANLGHGRSRQGDL
eukprot:TRINITY_DN33346_c0_g1_i1.p1 TRINITY_DN33346_c0_g1~~TRINITY_DN33346_c0_g1_i1.p1  ORF type:complete len:341 (-),score=75.74 TRINITY_DN33346_c0_g1_i1:196-1152(-)